MLLNALEKKIQGESAVNNACGAAIKPLWFFCFLVFFTFFPQAVCYYQDFLKAACLCSAEVKNRQTKFMFNSSDKKIKKVNGKKLPPGHICSQDLLQYHGFLARWDACGTQDVSAAQEVVQTHLHVRKLPSPVLSTSCSNWTVQIMYRMCSSSQSWNFKPLPWKHSLF